MKRQAVAAVVAFAAVTSMLVSRAEAVTAVNTVGTLARVNADALTAFGSVIDPATGVPGNVYHATAGTLLPLPAARQIWQVYPYADGSANTGVLVRDEVTLSLLGSFVVPDRLRRATLSPTGGGEWVNTPDGSSRVFVVGDTSVLAVDLATFAVTTVAPVDFTGPTLGAVRLAGITYDPGADDLYALYSAIAANSVGHVASVMRRIDLSTGTSQTRVIRSCRGFPANQLSMTLAAPMLIGATDLYVACDGPTGVVSPAKAVVVRLPLATALDPAGPEQAVNGPDPLEAVMVDESSGRLLLAGSNGVLTAFDTATMTFAWSIPVSAGSIYSVGRNPVSGEVYFQSTTGFGVVDGTSAVAPTPFVLSAAAGQAQERIVSQTGTTRVLVLPGVWTSKPPAYTIYDIVP